MRVRPSSWARRPTSRPIRKPSVFPDLRQAEGGIIAIVGRKTPNGGVAMWCGGRRRRWSVRPADGRQGGTGRLFIAAMRRSSGRCRWTNAGQQQVAMGRAGWRGRIRHGGRAGWSWTRRWCSLRDARQRQGRGPLPAGNYWGKGRLAALGAGRLAARRGGAHGLRLWQQMGVRDHLPGDARGIHDQPQVAAKGCWGTRIGAACLRQCWEAHFVHIQPRACCPKAAVHALEADGHPAWGR